MLWLVRGEILLLTEDHLILSLCPVRADILSVLHMFACYVKPHCGVWSGLSPTMGPDLPLFTTLNVCRFQKKTFWLLHFVRASADKAIFVFASDARSGCLSDGSGLWAPVGSPAGPSVPLLVPVFSWWWHCGGHRGHPPILQHGYFNYF